MEVEVPMHRILIPVLLCLASCRTTHDAPEKTTDERQVEVVRMRNTPEGAILTERVREVPPGAQGEPQEVVITAVGSPHEAQEPRGGPGPLRVPRAPSGPPEVERGRTISIDWRGDGLREGEVLDVRGNWVKLRFVMLEKGPEPNTTIGTSLEAWVDFSKVGYYIPGSLEKRKMKRKASAEMQPPKPRGEIQ